MNKKLYRNNKNAMVGGVCAGLSKYLDIDTVIVRLIFMLLFIFGGSGLIIYIIMWIMVPVENEFNNFNATYYNDEVDDAIYESEKSENENASKTNNSGGNMNRKLDNRQIIGIAMIVFGIFFIIDKFIPIQFEEYFFPAIMILVGALLVFNK